ncbi:MAG: glycosyltransferase [Dysgonomonas sp.]
MKNILIFNDSLEYGGTENLLVEVLNHLTTKDCEVTLLLPYPSQKDVMIKDVCDKVRIIYIHEKRPKGLKKIAYENIMAFYPRLFQKITGLKLNQYDLAVSFKDSVYSIIFSRLKQQKILWIHNLPTKDNYEIRSVKEFIPVKLLKVRVNRLIKSFRRFDKVVCVSEICKDRYANIFNGGIAYPNQEVEVLYNAINTDRIDRLSDEKVDFKYNPPVFITVTRFSIEKGIDRIIEAAHRLSSENYDFKVLIIGNGPLWEKCQNKIKKYNLSDIIITLGYVENPYPYIKESDWLICSSYKESFSLALLEGIFLHTPVITTDCGGPAEIVENGKYGIITANSTDGVYEGIKKALDSPELKDKYDSLADECLKRFEHDKWINSVYQIFGV